MNSPIVLPTVVCTRRGVPHLCGADVPSGLQALVVERTTCPSGNPACSCKPAISVVGGIGEDGMERALADHGGCVEVAFGKLLSGPNLLPTLKQNGLYMALSTGTAYSLAPARLFCAVLAQRLELSDSLRDSMELAVHEAVMNGLLHGNLEVSSDGRQTLEGFQRYSDEIHRRLDDPSLSARTIEIYAIADDGTVELCVADCGPGYDADALQVGDADDRKSGRGLMLIRNLAQQVTIDDGGRRLIMRFSRG